MHLLDISKKENKKQKQSKATKKVCEKCQILSKDEKEKNPQFARERYKILLEHEKQGWSSIEKSIIKLG